VCVCVRARARVPVCVVWCVWCVCSPVCPGEAPNLGMRPLAVIWTPGWNK
jgi:hypothetical protein